MQSKRYIARFSTPLYYMRTSSSRYKKCLKTKRDKMLLKKKNLSSEKKFSEVTKKRRKETTQAGYSFIYDRILDSN